MMRERWDFLALFCLATSSAMCAVFWQTTAKHFNYRTDLLLDHKWIIPQKQISPDNGPHLSILRRNDRRSDCRSRGMKRRTCDSWKFCTWPNPAYELAGLDKQLFVDMKNGGKGALKIPFWRRMTAVGEAPPWTSRRVAALMQSHVHCFHNTAAPWQLHQLFCQLPPKKWKHLLWQKGQDCR